MDLEDVPIVGQLLAVVGAVGDLLINSGEAVAAIVVILVSNVEIMLPIFSTLARLSDRLNWLPAGLVNQLVTGVLVTLFVIYVLRLLTKLQERNNAN